MSEPVSRIVRVTSKRQFTIPKVYFEKLRLGDKAKCYLEGDRLVIEPVREDSFWDFSIDILRSLIAEGYAGEALIAEFEARKKKTVQAFGRMIEEAREEAEAGKGKPAELIFNELLGGENV